MPQKELTMLQTNFVMAYTAFGMDTYSNGLLSIKVAGSKAKTDNALMATASEILSYPNVKAKIRAIEAARAAQLAVKTGFTVEQAQLEYEKARLHAETYRQPAAEVSAITGKCRLYGYDKDNAIGEKTVIIIGPRVAGNPVKAIESEVIDDI